MTATPDELIELILKWFNDHPNRRPTYTDIEAADLFFSINAEAFTTALDKMVSFGLLEIDASSRYKLARAGYHSNYIGGWQKFREYKRQKSALTLKQIQSTIDTNDLIKRYSRKQNIILWVTFIVATVSAVGTIGQWLLPLSKDFDPKPVKAAAIRDSTLFQRHHTLPSIPYEIEKDSGESHH